MKSFHYISAFLIVSVFLSLSLSINLSAQEIKKIIWPEPPSEPKIRYEGSLKELFGKKVSSILDKPYGIAIDDKGRLYVTSRQKVLSFDLKNRKYTVISGKEMRYPIGIALSSDGRLFVSDAGSSRILIYSKDGLLTGFIQKGLKRPGGIAIDEQLGRIYIADTKDHMIKIYSLHNYELLKTIGERGIGEKGLFNFPTNITLDKEGNLYVVDTGNFRIQIFNKEGKYLKAFGRIGDTPGSFARPKGIALDSEGNIYVVDSLFQNVQVFDHNERFLFFWGKGGLGPGYFGLPSGIAVDSNDRIYVVDQLGDIQLFQYLKDSKK